MVELVAVANVAQNAITETVVSFMGGERAR